MDSWNALLEPIEKQVSLHLPQILAVTSPITTPLLHSEISNTVQSLLLDPQVARIAFIAHAISACARMSAQFPASYKDSSKSHSFVFGLLIASCGVLGGGTLVSLLAGEPIAWLANPDLCYVLLGSFLLVNYVPFLARIVNSFPFVLVLGVLASLVRTLGVVGGHNAAHRVYSHPLGLILLGTIGGSGGAFLPWILYRLQTNEPEKMPAWELTHPSFMGLGISFICSVVYTLLVDSRYKGAIGVDPRVVVSLLFVTGFISFVIFKILGAAAGAVVGGKKGGDKQQAEIKEEFIDKSSNKHNNQNQNQHNKKKN